MSELIVVAFRDQFRAAEVINELRRREWDWVSDLDDAVAVMLDENGKARVQLNLDLSLGETASWIGLWSSLLRLALFIPIPGTTRTSVGDCSNPAPRNGDAWQSPGAYPDGAWWKEDLRISEDFLRDVGAVVKPDTSAIFMLLHLKEVFPVLRQLQNYGNMIIHTPLNPEQVEKMHAMLAVALEKN